MGNLNKKTDSVMESGFFVMFLMVRIDKALMILKFLGQYFSLNRLMYSRRSPSLNQDPDIVVAVFRSVPFVARDLPSFR